MTLTVHQSGIIGFLSTFADDWCVYEQFMTNPETGDDSLLFYGFCKLSEAMTFPDARRNTYWVKVVTPRTVLTHRVIASGSYAECLSHRGTLIAANRPIANLIGFDQFGRTGRIRCNETGVIYETQSAAADAIGARQSQISCHLRGLKGYRKVKGYTFSRIDE